MIVEHLIRIRHYPYLRQFGVGELSSVFRIHQFLMQGNHHEPGGNSDYFQRRGGLSR